MPETDDPARAARRLMTDDGFNVGVLYRGKRQHVSAQAPGQPRPSHLECEFAV